MCMLSQILPEGINQGVIIRSGEKFRFEDDKVCTRRRIVIWDNLALLLRNFEYACAAARAKGEDEEARAIVGDKWSIVKRMRSLRGKKSEEDCEKAA